ncbi:MAG: guanylate kinase [Bacteroidota bacterium]|nr:guanylate kinase [Bacteroidota bacterium]
MKNKIVAISGPSGTGKTTVVKELLKKFPSFGFSISATTRLKRDKEKDKKDYYFLSIDDFKNNIAENNFIEYEEVYSGVFYGTMWSEIKRMFSQNSNPLLDIDVFGALNIKKYYKNDALIIFIHPGTIDNLKNRLRKRKSESESSLKKRLAKANEEISFSNKFDKIIINDKDIKSSVDEVISVVNEYLNL